MKGWQRAFVLHRAPYRETSLLIDLFTEAVGRIVVIAKGVRRKNSPQKSILQAFTPLLVEYSGRGQVKTLCHVEALSLAIPLTGNALYSAFYINELLVRVFRAGMEPGILFSSYIECLQQLAKGHVPVEYVLRLFEFGLLDNLGYQLDKTNCDNLGLPLTEEKHYFYEPEIGFLATDRKAGNSFTGSELFAFAERDLSTRELLTAAKRFTQQALKPYTGLTHFKSRELFRSTLIHRPAHQDNH